MEATDLKYKGPYEYWFVGYGIVNPEWVENNGSGWRAGRIEVNDNIREYAVDEYSVLFKKDNAHFEDWCDELISKDQLSLEEILEMYKRQTGREIELWQPS